MSNNTKLSRLYYSCPMKYRLFQINVCANWGSTGRIAEQIGQKAIEAGWDSYIYYGDYCNPSQSRLIKAIGRFPFMYEHYFENRFFDREGLASRIPTLRLVSHLKRIRPDIVHLHNIHDHWINYPILFHFLIDSKIPVVWTFHDIWAITGHCYLNYGDCERWTTECHSCPKKSRLCIDRSRKNFQHKKELFSQLESLTIVPVSEWLGDIVGKSFLGCKPINVITNGVDTNVFRPIITDIRQKYNLIGKHLLIGVAQVWDKRKNLEAYLLLRAVLNSDYIIMLVGLSKTQISSLPEGIIGIERTQSQLELVQLYSAADITLSLSYAETFGLTIAESMSCGTPVVAYGNSAQSEVVKPGTGFTVPTDSISSLKDAIDRVISLGKSYFSDNCRLAANTYYNMDDNYGRYISLYNNMLRGGVILVAVASAWTEDKGLFDFIKLSKSLPDKCQLVLVGLTKEQIEKLPDNILGIERTDNVLDLVFLYNIASIVLSLSYSETFGLSIVEGMACGTPAIVYNNTAQKDIVTADTGLVVETGNIQAVNNAINIILTHGKSYYAASCRNRVCAFFDMDRQYQKYVSLYNNLLAIK